MSVDPGEFRATLGHFASGVVVVTGVHRHGPVGLTCQSFFSLSLDPPMVALAPGKSSTSWPRVAEAASFLRQRPRRRSGGPGPDLRQHRRRQVCRRRLVAGAHRAAASARGAGVDRLRARLRARDRRSLPGRGPGRRPGNRDRPAPAVLPRRFRRIRVVSRPDRPCTSVTCGSSDCRSRSMLSCLAMRTVVPCAGSDRTSSSSVRKRIRATPRPDGASGGGISSATVVRSNP